MDVKTTRFLTPYKLAVVCLCMLYSEDRIEPLSKVNIMMEVLEFLDGGSELEHGNNLIDGDLNSLKELLGDAQCTLRDESVYGAVVYMLWVLVASIDDLHEFIYGINEYLLQPLCEEELDRHRDIRILIGSESVLGCFLRRVYLEFDRMTYDEIVDFWRLFCEFRGPAPSDLEGQLKNYEEKNLGGLTALNIDSLFPKQDVKLVAKENLDRLLQQQYTNFERSGVDISPEVLQLLDNMSSTSTKESAACLPPSAYFVRYLDSCRSRDFQQALENLHHFYDYSLDDHTPRAQYHYALFSLAIMSAEFNNSEEALKAAEEAIAIGRQKGDHHFLSEILSWLYSYLETHPNVKAPESLASKEQMIQFLKARSWETSVTLNSLAFQSDALRLMGKSEQSLSAIFETLMKSSYMNVVSGAVISGASCNLSLSALWSRCGVDVLAEHHLHMTKDINSESPNASIALQTDIRLARLRFSKGNYKKELENFKALRFKDDSHIVHRQLWLWNLYVMYLNASINERRLDDARVMLTYLNRADEGLPLDIQFEVKLAEIKYYSVCGDTPKATQMAVSQAALVLELEFDMLYHLKFDILYIRALLESTSESRALTMILKTYSVAERVSLVPICIELLLLLAKLSSSQGHYRDSISIIDRVMPRLLETENASLIAEAYETIADSSIGLAQSRTQKQDLCHRAFSFLGQAGEFYQQIGDVYKGLEVCLKQGTICELGGFGHQKQNLERAKDFFLTKLEKNKNSNTPIPV